MLALIALSSASWLAIMEAGDNNHQSWVLLNSSWPFGLLVWGLPVRKSSFDGVFGQGNSHFGR